MSAQFASVQLAVHGKRLRLTSNKEGLMTQLRSLSLLACVISLLLSVGCNSDDNVQSHQGGGGSAGSGGQVAETTFFVTSDTSATADLGGLQGADARCQRLAVAGGLGAHTFHAYLS